MKTHALYDAVLIFNFNTKGIYCYMINIEYYPNAKMKIDFLSIQIFVIIFYLTKASMCVNIHARIMCRIIQY